LPFNAFHQHQIDEHNFAIASHQKNHFCEIDKNFCAGDNPVLCGHEHHINAPLEKCFTCQFHFEKTFDSLPMFSCKMISSQINEHQIYIAHEATLAAKIISNKGPPSKMFIG